MPQAHFSTGFLRRVKSAYFKGILLIAITLTSNTLHAQEPTVGVILNDSLVSEGYTLITPQTNKKTFLIDNCGLIVHEWESNSTALIAYLLPDGRLLRGGSNLEILNWNSQVVWSYTGFTPEFRRHHDLQILPNGNFLTNSYITRDFEYLKALGRDTITYPSQELWDEGIIEFKPVGTNDVEFVWEWYASDHISQNFSSSLPNYGDISDMPHRFDVNHAGQNGDVSADWLHFNSLDYNAELDQILISSLTFSEIFIIDHSTTTQEASGHSGGNAGKGGDILFRWGNPAAYGKGTEEDMESHGQHDPQWLYSSELGEYIMLFNNQYTADNSAITFIDPVRSGYTYPLDTDGKFQLTQAAENIIPFEEFKSGLMSGVQQLADGHLLSTEALKGRITEYDPETDEVLWMFVNPVRRFAVTAQGQTPINNSVFKSRKYPPNFSGFTGKNLTPTVPMERDPWNSDCYSVDTTEDSTGLYTLDLNAAQTTLYPNPTRGKLTIQWDGPAAQYDVYDGQGRVWMQGELLGEQQLDLQMLARGWYFLRIRTDDGVLSHPLLLLP